MSTTGNTLIRRAMLLNGSVASGANPSADEYSDGLLALNDMLNAWATERLTIYSELRQTKALVASTQGYTIGSGGTINVARPLWVHNASVIPLSQTNEIVLDVISDDEWAKIAIKPTTSTVPTTLFYDYGFNSSGLGTINVWPIPTTAATLVLYLPQALTAFADGTTSYSFPPGYERMLRYNLAVDLAPEYGVQVDPAVSMIAVQSKANVKRANIRMETMAVDAALLTGKSLVYDYRTDV